jgi:hypothetical protein
MIMARDRHGWYWVDFMTELFRADAVEDRPDLFRFPDGSIDLDALDAEVPREYFARLK